MRRDRLFRWFLSAVLLVSFALRLYQMGAWELTFDEVASFIIARQPPLEMLAYLQNAVREHPPLYYFLLSVWMTGVGYTEFALRFLSAWIGTVTVMLFYRCTASWIGRGTALIASLLLALSPAHIWVSQTARMYALVVLLSLLSIRFFGRLLGGNRGWKDWLGFALITVAGLVTHYYFVFIVAVENVLLLIGGRRYRSLWPRWAMLHSIAASVLALWLVGTGPRSTFLHILHHGPAVKFRGDRLVSVLNEVVFGPYRHVYPPVLLIFGVLVAVGLVGMARGHLWRSLGSYGAVLTATWLLAPPAFLLVLPVPMEGRYVIGMVLPLCLAIATAVVQLHSHWWPAALLALLTALVPMTTSLPEMYHDRFGIYRARVERLREDTLSDELLILNGPWQQLLLAYYDPGDLRRIPIPPAAPPGIDPVRADQTLTTLLDHNRRVWVSYDSLDATDPDRFVARWLYKHTHQVMEEKGLALYYRAPASDLPYDPTNHPPLPHRDLPFHLYLPVIHAGEGRYYEEVWEEGLLFGNVLQLHRAGVVARQVESGDAILVAMEWEALQDLERPVRMQLDLVGEDGWVWSSYAFPPAPFDLPAAPWLEGELRLERRGVRVPVGTPPGHYTVHLKVFGPDGNLLATPEGEEITLTSVEVLPSVMAQEVGWVRSARPLAVLDGRLDLLRCRPYGDRFSPSHPLPFMCYWRAREPLTGTYSVLFRFVAADGETAREVDTPLSSRYPPSRWSSGEVIATPYGPLISPNLPPGRYRLDIEVHRDGQPLGEAIPLFPFEVEAWPAVYRLPPVEHRLEATLGGDIHLRGYDLVREGDRLRLTLYWQADKKPREEYFVLVHVGLANKPPVAQGDGVPAEWLRPTTTWRPREIIADTHEISLTNVPSGRYGLYVGLYDPDTGRRLEAVVNGTPTADGRVLLETIEVDE